MQGGAVLQLQADASSGRRADGDDPRPEPDRGAAHLRGAGEGVDEGDGVGDRLTRNAQRAIGLEAHLDTVGEGVLGQVAHRAKLLPALRREPGTALPQGGAELLHQLSAQGSRAQDQPGLQLSRVGVEAGVKDPRVGAAGTEAEAGLGLEQNRGNTAPSQCMGDGAADDAASDDCDLGISGAGHRLSLLGCEECSRDRANLAVNPLRKASAMATKIWFITGSSRGFGRQWAEAALARGDKVAATARRPETLEALTETYGVLVLVLELDVTDREAAFDAVARAHEHFGRLDVVVNNAGYGLFGTIEEVSEQQARDQIETNLFGALWVTQAALPFLREQGSGHIVQVSSIGGIAAFPGVGLYHASKWALEGFSEALAQEVAGFGINVTLVEPGGFDTDWSGSSAVRAEQLPAYEAVHEQMRQRRSVLPQGRTDASAPAILEVVDAEKPPLRVFFGTPPLGIAKERYAERLRTWEEWNDVAVAAQGD